MLVYSDLVWMNRLRIAPGSDDERRGLVTFFFLISFLATLIAALVLPWLLEGRREAQGWDLYMVLYVTFVPLQSVTLVLALTEQLTNSIKPENVPGVLGRALGATLVILPPIYLVFSPEQVHDQNGILVYTTRGIFNSTLLGSYVLNIVLGLVPVALPIIRRGDWLRENQLRSRLLVEMFMVIAALRALHLGKRAAMRSVLITFAELVVRSRAWYRYTRLGVK